MSLGALFAAVLFGLIETAPRWIKILDPGSKVIFTDGGHGVSIVLSFLLAAFAPKALQRFAEGATDGTLALRPGPTPPNPALPGGPGEG